MNNIVIGTAGHIDHGKTTLIKALTGRETDTLKEEKKRGISINLGFTYFDLPSNKRAGIVDVPGHEKFIKNMLAGASGLDIVLLVVAADEGVMPQTVEHLDILTFLNIKKGIIVLTKIDNVDEDFIELAKEDVLERVKGTFLEDAEVVEVDSISKKGIDKLINKIDELSNEIEDKNENMPARLNIDRVFTVKGFGTVVTGTLLEGKINIDDELVVYPQEIKTKIRSIQVHGENVNVAYAGQRTAINISNVRVEDITRGDVLASPNSLEEAMMLDVKLQLVSHVEKDLKHWDRLRLYHGTREIMCRAVPLETETLGYSKDGYVQLRLEESIMAKKGDTFVVRTYSPMQTIGGGTIIDVASKKHKRFDENTLKTLERKEKGELKDILEEYLKQNSNLYPNIKDMMSYSGENEENIRNAISILEKNKNIVIINNMYIHNNHYVKLKEKIIDLLQTYHKKNRLRKGIGKEEIRSKIESKFKTKDMDKLLEIMAKDEYIKINNNIVSLYEFERILNERQKDIMNRILSKINSKNKSDIYLIEDVVENNNYIEVMEYMFEEHIEKLDDQHIIKKESYVQLKQELVKYLEMNKEITLGEYRDLISSSRKNCMIILESFDKNKITKRIENKRILY